jgi:hypothetical protein
VHRNLTSVAKLPKALHKHFKSVTNLIIECDNNEVLLRFVKTHKPSKNFPALKRLVIRGGGHRFYLRTTARHALHCDFIGPTARETLERLIITSVIYQRDRDTPQAPAIIHRFPALKVLQLLYCEMDYSYTPRVLSGAEKDYQQDPLHDLLRGADQLRILQVSLSIDQFPSTPDPVPRPRLFKRVEMKNLVSAELPPPAVWAIDILAPVLDSLIFKGSFDYRDHDRGPWIPELQDAPVPFERLGKLKGVEFVCKHLDDISRLRAWLSQLDTVTSLILHNSEYNRWYPESQQNTLNDVMDGDRDGGAAQPEDVRASIRLAQLFADQPELCPSMTELKLDHCYTNGKSLVEFVRKRKALEGCANIQHLELQTCTQLSRKAYTALVTEVPTVTLAVRAFSMHVRPIPE